MTVHFAETLFRWLMRAYPARFRRTHGLALFELFRDEAREAQRERGSWGVALVLVKTLADTITSAPAAWSRREPTRPTSPPALSRVSATTSASPRDIWARLQASRSSPC
jgi:hypothetical protein